MSASQAKEKSKLGRRKARKQLRSLQHTVAETVNKLIVTAEELDKVEKYFATSIQALRSSSGDYIVRDALAVMDDAWERLALDISTDLDAAVDALDPDGAETRLRKRQRRA